MTATCRALPEDSSITKGSQSPVSVAHFIQLRNTSVHHRSLCIPNPWVPPQGHQAETSSLSFCIQKEKAPFPIVLFCTEAISKLRFWINQTLLHCIPPQRSPISHSYNVRCKSELRCKNGKPWRWGRGHSRAAVGGGCT